jgi:hypothetical protein
MIDTGKIQNSVKLALCNFNGKELFWENLKGDYENEKLDCYKARLEEIVNSYRSITRKYW